MWRYPEIRKKSALSIVIAVLIIAGLLSLHSSIAGNLVHDSHRAFKALTINEMTNPLNEFYETWRYLFINPILPIVNYCLGGVFVALVAWHLVKRKTYIVDLNKIALMLGCIELVIVLLALLPARMLPDILSPFVSMNSRLAEFMAPFCLLIYATLALRNFPPLLLAAFILVTSFFAIWGLTRIEIAVVGFHTIPYADAEEIYKILPETDTIIFAGDRRYEVLGSYKHTITATSYFDCPLPGNFQFPRCHRALNQGFAMQNCALTDEIVAEIKSDFPNRDYFFVTQNPWGSSQLCVDMKAKYFSPVLDSGNVVVLKLR
jgi:hypothetical protein